MELEDEMAKTPKPAVRMPPAEAVLMDGRRPALYKPTPFELEKMRNRTDMSEEEELKSDDADFQNRAFWTTFIRVNPMKRKDAVRVDAADWGDTDNPLMGPNGPSFIGKVFRDPMSAKVKLVFDGHNRYDFHAVDLWTRPVVEGTMDKLKKDRYLYKPIPLLYRTWMYHEAYRSHTNGQSTSDETGVIREVLKYSCIDADISAGRWSPLVAIIPASFCCAVTCDELSVGAVVILAWIMQRAGMLLNNPDRYKELRGWLLLPRLAWVAFIIYRAFLWLPDAAVLNVIGLVGSLLFVLLDLFFGDREVMNKYRLNCFYEIVKILPNRIFVCRRKGAADLENLFGGRGRVHQNVTGMGAWGKDMALIAEIMGCIFELRPFIQKDWDLLVEQSAGDDNARLNFWGLDCYTNLCPTWIDLRRRQQADAAALLSKVGTMGPRAGPADGDKLLSQLQSCRSLFEQEKQAQEGFEDIRQNSPPGTPKNQAPLDDDLEKILEKQKAGEMLS
ncbi:unnamed protein product [Effrenium voratum]|nr:unnamed protein product [Effrenium voratum]|eukprot:CAMPEP_0181404640 /NCGR_PEP_ID=MMETSP1110-20121109/4353_1 /TAXON_ID=174948 /ORGANISM="Symbiodinium sp., Strain CCMP421" /LENGTH=501 /DNA_ID=CAMNT_0023527013 /DNA_START=39 /DNA_END=1544 /DNA_ORIENTATION=-